MGEGTFPKEVYTVSKNLGLLGGASNRPNKGGVFHGEIL